MSNLVNNISCQSTVQVTANTISASTTFSGTTDIAARSFMVSNEGPNHAYIGQGLTTATASVPNATPALNCVPVLTGQTVIFFKAKGNDTIAYITKDGATILDITPGSGG